MGQTRQSEDGTPAEASMQQAYHEMQLGEGWALQVRNTFFEIGFVAQPLVRVRTAPPLGSCPEIILGKDVEQCGDFAVSAREENTMRPNKAEQSSADTLEGVSATDVSGSPFEAVIEKESDIFIEDVLISDDDVDQQQRPGDFITKGERAESTRQNQDSTVAAANMEQARHRLQLEEGLTLQVRNTFLEIVEPQPLARVRTAPPLGSCPETILGKDEEQCIDFAASAREENTMRPNNAEQSSVKTLEGANATVQANVNGLTFENVIDKDFDVCLEAVLSTDGDVDQQLISACDGDNIHRDETDGSSAKMRLISSIVETLEGDRETLESKSNTVLHGRPDNSIAKVLFDTNAELSIAVEDYADEENSCREPSLSSHASNRSTPDSLHHQIEQAQRNATLRISREKSSVAMTEHGVVSHRRRRQRKQSTQPPNVVAKYLPSASDLIMRLKAEDQELRLGALKAIRGLVLNLSLDGAGCRVVQQALDVPEDHQASELTGELRGHVVELSKSLYGNFVIQKAIKRSKPSHVEFITEELHGVALTIAKHKQGCRVLQRMIEHSSGVDTRIKLIDTLLKNADSLCRHDFGHHVMASVLEHCPWNQQKNIIEVLCCNLKSHVSIRNSNFVLEAALKHCPEGQRRLIEHFVIGGADMSLLQLGQLRSRIEQTCCCQVLSSSLPFHYTSVSGFHTNRISSFDAEAFRVQNQAQRQILDDGPHAYVSQHLL